MKPDEINHVLNRLCDLAEKETISRFRTNTSVINKLDEGFDPVTEADKAAERVIRETILKLYPEHGVIGEEYGQENPTSDYCWIIDPIDGTRAFVSGLPTWGTLIGLYNKGKPIAGIMHQPFTGERYSCDGNASILEHNGTRSVLASSRCVSLSEATIMTTTPAFFSGAERSVYNVLESNCKLARYGADCYAYCLLASGQIELVVEAGLNIYDIAALIPIIESSGGIVTNWHGGDASQGGQVLAAANTQLHKQALEILGKVD